MKQIVRKFVNRRCVSTHPLSTARTTQQPDRMRPTPKPKPSLPPTHQLQPKQRNHVLRLDMVVDKEAPKQHLLILAPMQATAVNVCAHFNGHLELYAAVAEKSE